MMIKKMFTLFMVLFSVVALSGLVGADVFQGTTLKNSINVKSGIDITALGGASDFDFSASSGTFKTPTGANTISGVASFSKNVVYSVNATTVLNTTLTSANTKTVYGIDASGASKALVLPDAATVTGRMYMISTSVDPGAYNVVITATGGDTIGGSASKTTTTLAGMTLISDGTVYLEVGSYGTWT